MPIVSEFFGIKILMFWNEEGHHSPHFHAVYGNHKASISIADLRILEGELPKRVRSLVIEWAFECREQLLENWKLAKARKPIKKIPPLE